jgi:hypothetical protein
VTTFEAHRATVRVLADIQTEREAQDEKWGEQNHPDGTGGIFSVFSADDARARCQAAFAAGNGTWRHVLDEEIAEAYAETDPALLRVELIQAAAVIAAWIEALDRR